MSHHCNENLMHLCFGDKFDIIVRIFMGSVFKQLCIQFLSHLEGINF